MSAATIQRSIRRAIAAGDAVVRDLDVALQSARFVDDAAAVAILTAALAAAEASRKALHAIPGAITDARKAPAAEHVPTTAEKVASLDLPPALAASLVAFIGKLYAEPSFSDVAPEEFPGGAEQLRDALGRGLVAIFVNYPGKQRPGECIPRVVYLPDEWQWLHPDGPRPTTTPASK